MREAHRAFIALFLLTAMFLTAACNSATAPPPSGTAVSLFDGRVSFDPPPGLKQISIEAAEPGIEINPEDQQFAFANDDKSVILVVRLAELPVAPEQLEGLKKVTEGTHRDYSGWKTSEIVTMNGRQWFNFEWVTPPPNELELLVAPPPVDGEPTPVPRDERAFHYHSYSTSFNNKLLSFNYKALPERYKAHKEDLIRSANSINIKN
jgi:hypothetical protein